jgi:flagellar hook-length control protein FliK
VPEAWTVIAETATLETPRKDEPSKRETKSISTDQDAATVVVTPDAMPVTAVSSKAEPNGRESRQSTTREIQIETVAKAHREIEALAPPSSPSSTRSETRGLERHDTIGSTVVPHSTKAPGAEFVKPLETVPSDQTTQWTQIEKSDIVSQLLEKARSLRLDRSSEIVVSLKPESLGRISMRASLVDRTMVATIAAESDKVRQLLQLELPAIQKSLQETGIVAKVAVSEQSDLNFGNNLSHGQPRFRQNDALPFREELISQNPAATTEVADARYSTHSVHLIA